MNQSSIDRVVRVMAGSVGVFTGLGLGLGSMPGALLIATGLVAVLTGVIGFCPLYAFLRINTRKV